MFRYSLIPFFLIFFTLNVYWSAVTFDFVWDDEVNVVENPYLKTTTLQNTLHFWKEPYQNLYIPLTYALLAIESHLSKYFITDKPRHKLNPQIFHLGNIILHLMSVLVVFAILRLVLNSQLIICDYYFKDLSAGLGALLFAIHPIQVEPVAWVTGTKDVLCGLLSLIAVWQYFIYATEHIKFQASNPTLKNSPFAASNFRFLIYNPHYLFAFIAFVLAMLAKPSAATLPVVVVVLDRWLLNRSLKDSLLTILLWLMAALPFMILTKFIQPGVEINFHAPLWTRSFIAGDALAFYMYKLVVPFRLCVDYGHSPVFVLKQIYVFFTWFFPFGVIILLWLKKDAMPYKAAALIFIAGILPVLGFIPFIFQNYSTVADRYLYFSMLGPAMALSCFISRSKKKPIVIVCVIILSLLGVRSSFQLWNWGNETSLFEHTLKLNPGSWMAHNNLGVALFEQGKTDAAVAHYLTAVKINPSNAEAYNNLGNAAARKGKLREAAVYYRNALMIRPDYAKAHNNIGVLLAKQGETDDAVMHFSEAIKNKLYYSNAYNNMGIALKKQGKIDESRAYFSEALRLQPGRPFRDNLKNNRKH